jgi:hypothetical protein
MKWINAWKYAKKNIKDFLVSERIFTANIHRFHMGIALLCINPRGPNGKPYLLTYYLSFIAVKKPNSYTGRPILLFPGHPRGYM